MYSVNVVSVSWLLPECQNKVYLPEEYYVCGVGSRDSVFSATGEVLTAVLLKIKISGHFTLSLLVVTDVSAGSWFFIFSVRELFIGNTWP